MIRESMMRIVAGCAVLAAGFLCPEFTLADPLGTVFTYQGHLTDDGSPVNSSVNIEFGLFDVAAGGTALATQSFPAVAVTDGLFTVQIDFGSGMFTGSRLWLDITVNGTPLSPRQEITAAPYALYALNAPPSGGLALPYSGSASSASTAFAVSSTGSGGAGSFSKSGGTTSSLKCATTGVNNAVWALNSGGADITTIPEVPEDAAVSAWNLGTGPGVRALNGGAGRALFARVENTTSSADTIYADTTGTGRVVNVTNSPGLSPTTNALPVIWSRSFGTGAAALFVNGRGQGEATLDGAQAVSTGTNRQAAGLRAWGNGNTGPGAPRAAALDIYNGAINVSGSPLTFPERHRPAGTIVVPANSWSIVSSSTTGQVLNPTMDSDFTPHVHWIGWISDVTLTNNLIIAGGNNNVDESIILATVESKGSLLPSTLQVSYSVQVHSKAGGTCTFRVARMGRGFDPNNPNTDFPAPLDDPVVVHWIIVNPSSRP